MKLPGILGALLCGLLSISCAAAKEPIALKCDADACKVVDSDSGKVLMDDLPANTGVQPLGPQLLEITSSCGSPCSASAFYERDTKKLSDLFSDVIIALPDIGQVVYADNGGLFYSPIFGKGQPKPLKTTQPLADTAAVVSAVVSAAFVKPSSLKLTYLTGPEFKKVTETIPLTAGK